MRLTANEALNRLQGNGLTRRAKGEPLHLLDRVRSLRQDRLFIFGRGGTAIVAPADDTLPAQVAEFDFESGVINPAAQLLMGDYANEVKAVQEGGIDDVWQPPTVSPEVYVAPLMGDIAWHQHEPFNNRLEFTETKPVAGLVDKCLVGCPATAVSQLMYYFAKKGRGRGCVATDPYLSKMDGYQYNVPGEAARMDFDFGNMCDIYTKRKGAKYVDVVSYTEEQAQAVADLCAHVGKAMGMKYAPTGSGQFPEQIADAMENKLHLGKVTIYKQPTKADQYDTRYLDKVRSSLANGVPVVVCGWTSVASTAAGHCFVVEGYRPDDDMYYINWGWGKGFNDGWFKMSRLKYSERVSGFDFSFRKTFLILSDVPSIPMDVNGDGRINMSDVTKVINTANGGKYDPSADVNFDGKVDMGDANIIIGKILGKKDIEPLNMGDM